MKDNILDDFVQGLREKIYFNSKEVEKIFFSPYEHCALDGIRCEICKCYMCGLYQATITLTNHLLEKGLKYCLALNFSSENRDDGTEVDLFFKKGIDKYNDFDLAKSINVACSKKLISKKDKGKLHNFRDLFRNPFSHGNKKIFENIETDCVVLPVGDSQEKLSNLFSEIFDKNNYKKMLVEDLPFIQGHAQLKFSEENCLGYFKKVDSIIREMLKHY